MSQPTPPLGTIAWCDLSVPNATAVRDFYSAVVGWTSTGFEMEGYEDYCMNRPSDGQTVAGICHQRGPNADIPVAWLVYITVPDLAKSLQEVVTRGGTVVRPAKEAGGGSMAIVRDPAGAIFALYQYASQSGT